MTKYQRLSAVSLAVIILGLGLVEVGCSSGSGGNGGSGGTSGGSGGRSGSGGSTASGGSTGSGGATSSGGAPASGGSPGSGGATSSGGAPASGGSPGSGGASASGGSAGGAGTGAAGGTSGAAGGTTGSGGAATATGGAGGGNAGGRNGGGAGRTGGGAGRTGAGGGSAIPMTITLTSPVLTEGGMFPTANACSSSSMTGASPELDWTAGPSGTMSYAMTLTDLDNASGPVHWAIWDIPATTMTLPANLATAAMLTTPMGARQTNEFSGSGYYGPCPNGNTHHYVFQVYAIPTATLPGMTNTTVAARDSMRAAAIATGMLAGTSDARRN